MGERIGIVGARGHVGADLIRLVASHPRFELAFVSSRELDGQRVADHLGVDAGELRYSAPTPADLPSLGADAIVLALPNGKAAECVAGFDRVEGETPILLDLSADHRFDSRWHYGLPELALGRTTPHRRISNPGCYATAMQLAIAPMRDLLDGPVQCFGVSGYSGAGTTPSERNNRELLQDNLMPYALGDHIHGREATAQLGHPVEFMPHVASHFRGLSVTANLHLTTTVALDEVLARYRGRYAGERFVQLSVDAPWITAVAGRHHAVVGGFALADAGRRLVVVAVIDNLLKGAATQAMQNLNLAFGLDESAGLVAP